MSISIDVARRILEASKQRAKELRSPVSIAIVDAGGHLVLFERMMSPYGWATGNISIAKANTAVMFNQPTDAVAQWGSGIPGFASSMATMTDGKFIMAAGGWPIRIAGTTIGGIGVSGGNAPGRDEEIARAGLVAVGSQCQQLLCLIRRLQTRLPRPHRLIYRYNTIRHPQLSIFLLIRITRIMEIYLINLIQIVREASNEPGF